MVLSGYHKPLGHLVKKMQNVFKEMYENEDFCSDQQIAFKKSTLFKYLICNYNIVEEPVKFTNSCLCVMQILQKFCVI